jgi:hypothetical protein
MVVTIGMVDVLSLARIQKWKSKLGKLAASATWYSPLLPTGP